MAAQEQKPENQPATSSSTVSRAVDALSRAIAEMKEVVIFDRPSLESGQYVPLSREEVEAWSLVDTFDARLTEAEKRIDRVLGRLGVE